jgi:hypothetical protein
MAIVERGENPWTALFLPRGKICRSIWNDRA